MNLFITLFTILLSSIYIWTTASIDPSSTISGWPIFGGNNNSQRRWSLTRKQPSKWHLSDHDMRHIHIKPEDQGRFNETLSKILVPRVPDTPSHAGVRMFIENYLQNLDWSVETDEFQSSTPYGEKSFTNIVATLNPNACKRVVLACHYDSKYFPDFEFLAATDSAVPCTMILELIRQLDPKLKRHRQMTNDVTLQVFFFDGEEAFQEWSHQDSLYGSRHLAAKFHSQSFQYRSQSMCGDMTANGRNIRTELDRIELFILLDLIGEASPEFCSHSRKTKPVYDMLPKIERHLNKLKVLESKRSSGTRYFPPICYSARIEDDHIPFEHKGVPVIHLIATPFPINWHKAGDNGSNLHHPTINNLMKIFHIFLIEYFKLN